MGGCEREQAVVLVEIVGGRCGLNILRKYEEGGRKGEK